MCETSVPISSAIATAIAATICWLFWADTARAGAAAGAGAGAVSEFPAGCAGGEVSAAGAGAGSGGELPAGAASATAGKYDAIILAVAHNQFKDLNYKALLAPNGIIYDVKGFLPREIVDARL